jgi:hypothetical protein
MSAITIQVPEDLAEILAPADGSLSLDRYWMTYLLKGAANEIGETVCSIGQEINNAAERAVVREEETTDALRAAVLRLVDDCQVLAGRLELITDALESQQRRRGAEA